ncbi:hypothetical protein [Jannaschia seosinensis]|uniref:hypothetical protein n=1 Tax=Jannaschia seosinensis TaxID=313367 RepID=UPI0006E3A800|nr:hypothetical protein [Jannaschia seosinensis]
MSHAKFWCSLKNDSSFRSSPTEFTQQNRPDEEGAYDIKEGLKSFLNRLSRQLLQEVQDTREFLNQLSSAMGTKESIAAQQRINRLLKKAGLDAVSRT